MCFLMSSKGLNFIQILCSNLSADVWEAVGSLIFAASRCGELPELYSIRILFTRLLGENFERTNVELLPGNRVNSQIKHNLCKRSVSEDEKIQLLNEIATEEKQDLQLQIKVVKLLILGMIILYIVINLNYVLIMNVFTNVVGP